MKLRKLKLTEEAKIKLLVLLSLITLMCISRAFTLIGFVWLGTLFFGLIKLLCLSLVCIVLIHYKELPAFYIERKCNRWILLGLFLCSVEASIIVLYQDDWFLILCVYVYIAWVFFNLWQRCRRRIRKIIRRV